MISTPTILFEDANILVIHKPSGMPSQDGSQAVGAGPSVVAWAREHVGRHYIGLVHRLDQETEGLMVLGKRSKAANRLTDALQGGRLKRRYLALALGTLSGNDVWKDLLQLEKGEKEATTITIALQNRRVQGHAVTLMDLELETGRKHQIRIQAALRDHPILGDRKYGGTRLPPPFQRLPLGLLSSAMSFPHPISDEVLSFKADFPKSWIEMGFKAV